MGGSGAVAESWQEVLGPFRPTVGAAYVYSVRGETRDTVLSVMAELTTSATVGNRGLGLTYRTGRGSRFLVAGTAATVPASTTQAFCWQASAGTGVWPVADAALAGMPAVMMMPTWTLTVGIVDGFAGDQLDNVTLLVERTPTSDTTAGKPDAPVLDKIAFEAIRELADAVKDQTNVTNGLATQVNRLRFARAPSPT